MRLMSLPRASVARLGLVGRASLRVALATTAVVAVLYLVLAGAVYAIVSNNLTSQVDDRLQGALTATSQRLAGIPDARDVHGPPGDREFDAPLLGWLVGPGGRVVANIGGATLPASARSITSPQTVSVGAIDVRIAGMAVGPNGGSQLLVGQSLDPVKRAQATLLRAEVILGPVVLLVVFLGAVATARRVAAPIERARVRQLEFTADASHELRTPLAVIEANTSLALSQPRDEKWYRSAFERVDAESHRMRRLVEDMLWLARFDATDARPDSEPIDLGVLAQNAANRFAAVAETRHLSLDVRVDRGPNVVRAPGDWLDRLLGVLLDNACKYAPQGGRVLVRVEPDANRVRLVVEDSGPGIPPDQRDRIFDRFHRGTNAAVGSGLGLAIADAIVRATNGRWQIGESPDGGASMSVSWPRAFDPKTTPNTRAERAAMPPAVDVTERI
jgi:two-component system, OmpR family, sensor histidine kinase CiaH